MEVTTWVEALWGKGCGRYATPQTGTKPETAETAKGGAKSTGGSATMQAGTRVNAEQASKRVDAEADPPSTRGRPPTGREESDGTTGWFPPG